MKKLIFIFTLLILTMGIYANEQTDTVYVTEKTETTATECVTGSNTEKLTDKYSSQIKATIISLAQELQQPAEYVYKILIKQQRIKAYTSLPFPIILIISIIVLLFTIPKSKWGIGEYYYDSDDPKSQYYKGKLFNIHALLTIIFGIALIATLAGTCTTFSDMITGFINPEYGAIQDIISVFK